MTRPITQRAEDFKKRLNISDVTLLGFRFAANVAISSTIVWTSVRLFGDNHPIWAIASLIASSDPQPIEARRMFRSRIINVLVGCAVGLIFLLVAGTNDWVLPIALATTVIISSSIVRIKTMWRQAPITAAIVVAAGITLDSKTLGIHEGFYKVIEVIFGCLVGLIVSWLMSKVWIIKLKQ
jgi:uncharacterized membrane protein YccC